MKATASQSTAYTLMAVRCRTQTGNIVSFSRNVVYAVKLYEIGFGMPEIKI